MVTLKIMIMINQATEVLFISS